MKTLFLAAIGISAAIGSARLPAQWAVIDAANLQQSITQYAVLAQQLSKQAAQVSNQIQQIQRMDTQLSRMGNMADVTVIVGFPELHTDMKLPSKTKTWDEILGGVNGTGIYGDTRGGIYRGVTPTFPDFDGEVIPRDPEIYKPAHEITATVDNHKEVEADVHERREKLKVAIVNTSEALRTATTEAEAMKQQAILQAEYSQLASLDSEVALSAAQIQVKAAESDALENAESTADAEARGKLARNETEKLKTTFKPSYECLLQYVSEVPFQQ